jgi:aldehyde dehydrogenase (NAD(P)+)
MNTPVDFARLDSDLALLAAHKDEWARLPLPEKIGLLRAVRAGVARVAERWVDVAVRAKGIPDGSPWAGEEWMSGPYSLLFAIAALERTLERLARGESPLPSAGAIRTRPDGQVVVDVFPADTFDRILHSGVRAEVWMEPGIEAGQVRDHLAAFYRRESPAGKVALVLGAGNISSIAPLDLLHELYAEGAVAVVKMNPVNDYLEPFLAEAFAPFLERGFVRFASGGPDVGAFLADHPLVEEIHITGSDRTYDAIRFGTGPEGVERKRRGEPRNRRRISAELGGVGPTIVVPGRWSASDLRFQAENVVSQKMHNGGFNCIASQVLVLSERWPQRGEFLDAVREAFHSIPPRHPYYPGAAGRQAAAIAAHPSAELLDAPGTTRVPRTFIPGVDASDATAHAFREEFFGGVLAETGLPGDTAADFLAGAVRFANERLRGTLGANLIVDPATARSLGTALDAAIAGLRYGSVSVNTWAGVAYLIPQATWGAFPGHTDADIQSGRGVVHNTLLVDHPQKTVVTGRFRPFPRAWMSGDFHLGPKPPWFVTHRTADQVGRLLTRFAEKPSLAGLPAIIGTALRG